MLNPKGHMGPMGDNENESAESRPLSIDTVLELLSECERRKLLEYLIEGEDDTATVEELLDHLVDDEADRTGEIPSRARFKTSLYHVHLPKLANAGILDYDSRSRQVRYYGHAQLETWIERIADAE